MQLICEITDKFISGDEMYFVFTIREKETKIFYTPMKITESKTLLSCVRFSFDLTILVCLLCVQLDVNSVCT